MLVRKLAVVAVASALLFGTAGCSFTRTPASKAVYAPSDGNQADAGSVHARNVLVLSDGTNAYLIGSLVNSSEEAKSASIEVTKGAKASVRKFEISSLGTVNFGYPAELGFVGSEPGIALEGTLPAVGSNVEIKLVSGANEQSVAVQVLDGTVPTYADLMPYLSPSTTPEATPSATPSASGN